MCHRDHGIIKDDSPVSRQAIDYSWIISIPGDSGQHPRPITERVQNGGRREITGVNHVLGSVDRGGCPPDETIAGFPVRIRNDSDHNQTTAVETN